MKEKSEYLEVAIRYSKNTDILCGICSQLSNSNSDLFYSTYHPNPRETKKYNMGEFWWMTSLDLTTQENNNFRILALLFMHEMTKK